MINPGRIRAGAVAFAFSLTLASQVLAQSEPAKSRDTTRTTDLQDVVVIGTREQARLATGSAYVIRSEELRQFEFTNVHSILRSVPGVYLREEDGLGTFPRIGIRASSSGRSDRISILEDGIPAAMAPYANTSAYYFPAVGRMSSVEVLKGPEILRYGPQTTSGAINLLSTPIPESPTGFVNVELGAWDTRKVHTWAGGTFGQFGFLVEAYPHRTDGFQRIDRSTRTAGNDIADYLLKLRWKSDAAASVQQQLDLKLLHGTEYADVSYLGLTDADFRRNPDRRYGLSELERMNRGRKSASLQYRIGFAPGITLVTTGYYTDTHRDYTRLNQINGVGIGGSGVTSQINNGGANAALLQGILDGTANTTHANGVRYGNNYQNFIAKGVQLEARTAFTTGTVAHELVGGIRRHEDESRNTATETNLIYDQVNGSLVFRGAATATPNEGYAKATAFWLADRIRIGDLALLPLLRHERISSRADVAVPTSARNRLEKTTLGLGVNYEIGPQWTVLAGVHQGFAPPGSGAIEGSRGEESTNFEGGFRFRRAAYGLDLIGFYSDYDNALRNCLVANPCADGAILGVQQDGAKQVYGVELGFSGNLVDRNEWRLPVRLAYTYTEGKYTRGADVANGVQQGDVLDYTPKHIGRLVAGVEHSAGLALNLGLNYAGSTCTTTTCERPGVDSRFLVTESLVTLDLSASYALTSSIDLYARGENLLDERRISHRGSDGARGNPGRYFGTGLRVHF